MSGYIHAISDLHFGHRNMALKRGFASVKEHDKHIIDTWNSVVKNGDTIWILGDITMEKANYEILDQLTGYKKVVLGNHDLPKHVPKLLKHVNSVCGIYTKMKNFILSHYPVHPNNLAGKINIHGHLHEKSVYFYYEYDETYIKDSRNYINVSCEEINYTPVKLIDLI